MSRFDPRVLANDPVRRTEVVGWLERGLLAVDPERLTREALDDSNQQRPAVIIAIGKAAPAMARGAAECLEVIGGVCVSDHSEAVPPMIRAMAGNHPLPGAASFEAGKAVVDCVVNAPADARLLALVSGGGSAVCESPRPGISADYLSMATGALLKGGASIGALNLVRRHLSSIKCGGLARAAGRPIETLVLSDVAGADPAIVASGPTIPTASDPAGAREVLVRHHIEVPDSVWEAMNRDAGPLELPTVTLLGDGRTAAQAVGEIQSGPYMVMPGWLDGDIDTCLDHFLAGAGPGVTIAAGEPVVEVNGSGTGGRNTHAALLAARRLVGTNTLFTAFATDGVDGLSGTAGAIVDGRTIERGGDPARALADFDSANYLATTGDLLICPPTGTNVADLWILRRQTPPAT
ncbi:MAG TPA: DUF4147 domain-containing protein [Acidimicrobiia bacterium]